MQYFLKRSEESVQKRIYALEQELSYLEDMVQFSQDQSRILLSVYERAGREFGLKNPQKFYQWPLLKFCYQFKIIGGEELDIFYTPPECSYN